MLSYLIYLKLLTHFHIKFFSRNSNRYIFHLRLVFCSDKKSEIALEILQDNIYKLEEYFCLNKVNLNGSKTEFITFSLKNDKRLNDSETVTVGSTLVKISDQCKYLGVTIDKHLGFQTQVKKVLKNMAVGIKTVETVQHRFPTGELLMLFHALVMSHLEYSLLFFFSKLVLLCCSH